MIINIDFRSCINLNNNIITKFKSLYFFTKMLVRTKMQLIKCKINYSWSSDSNFRHPYLSIFHPSYWLKDKVWLSRRLGWFQFNILEHASSTSFIKKTFPFYLFSFMTNMANNKWHFLNLCLQKKFRKRSQHAL